MTSLEQLKKLPSYFTPEMRAKEEWEVGVDEAGRGPVLGPMVYGVCFWPISLKEKLGKIGFADSKQLSEEDRERYFEILKEINEKYCGYYVKVLDANLISNKML